MVYKIDTSFKNCYNFFGFFSHVSHRLFFLAFPFKNLVPKLSYSPRYIAPYYGIELIKLGNKITKKCLIFARAIENAFFI